MLDRARVAVQDQMLALDEQTMSMDSQIRQAQDRVDRSGEYADRDWWRRINFARRAKGRERQRCQQLLGDINRLVRKKDAEANDAAPERRFIAAARRLLPPETYRLLWAEAASSLPVSGIDHTNPCGNSECEV